MYIVFALIFFNPSSISATEGFLVCPPIKVAAAKRDKRDIIVIDTKTMLEGYYFTKNRKNESSKSIKTIEI